MTDAGASAWLVWALLSALFAALTAICAKLGVAGIDSDLATFIRTLVVAGALGTMLATLGKFQPVREITYRSWIFLILSGLATGASWVCYFRALKLGDASRVAPIDKLSVVMVALIGVFLLGERLSALGWAGISLISVGAILVAFS